MIIARADTKDGKPLLLFGLSKENITRLMDNQPIRMQPDTHPGIPEGWSIMIMYGETEASIALQLRAAGFMDKNTVVKMDPRLNS